jgi:hypothetical protein
MLHENLFDAIVESIAARVAEKLQPRDEQLSSRNCKAKLDMQSRTFNRHAQNVPGSHKIGKVWFCSTSAWAAHFAARTGAGSTDDDAYTQAVAKAGRR